MNWTESGRSHCAGRNSRFPSLRFQPTPSSCRNALIALGWHIRNRDSKDNEVSTMTTLPASGSFERRHVKPRYATLFFARHGHHRILRGYGTLLGTDADSQLRKNAATASLCARRFKPWDG